MEIEFERETTQAIVCGDTACMYCEVIELERDTTNAIVQNICPSCKKDNHKYHQYDYLSKGKVTLCQCGKCTGYRK